LNEPGDYAARAAGRQTVALGGINGWEKLRLLVAYGENVRVPVPFVQAPGEFELGPRIFGAAGVGRSFL